MCSRAECDLVISGGVAMTSECAGMVIVGVAVRIGTCLLEGGRVVLWPAATLAGLWCAVRSTATVDVCVELHTGAHAGHCPAAHLGGQLTRADGVQVTLTTGCVAVVVAIVSLLEATGRYHTDG